MKGDASYVPSATGPVNKLPNISAYNVSQDEIDWFYPFDKDVCTLTHH